MLQEQILRFILIYSTYKFALWGGLKLYAAYKIAEVPIS